MMEYSNQITQFEIVRLDLKFADPHNDREFYNIPTAFLLQNIYNRELWKHCPSLVNFDILGCIDQVKASGQYPYNSTVQAEFCARFNIVDPMGEGTTFLSAMVYCTQKYRHSIEAENSSKLLHERLTSEGYINATIEDLNRLVATKKKAFVLLNVTNVFGSETKVKGEKPFYLKKNGERDFIWMAPRATRRGYTAQIGQYIKTI